MHIKLSLTVMAMGAATLILGACASVAASKRRSHGLASALSLLAGFGGGMLVLGSIALLAGW